MNTENTNSYFQNLNFFGVISAFCATGVPQNVEITQKSPSTGKDRGFVMAELVVQWLLKMHHKFHAY